MSKAPIASIAVIGAVFTLAFALNRSPDKTVSWDAIGKVFFEQPALDQ